MVIPRAAVRPRLEGDRVREVREVALEVLAEVGYDRLTLDLVATRARAGKATLYRRWASKAELVADALATIDGDVVQPNTGSLVGDVTALLGDHHMLDPSRMGVVCGISTAMATDPDLKKALEQRYLAPRRTTLRLVLDAARARGEVDEDVDLDLVSSILPALMIFWTMSEGCERAVALAPKMVEEILLPVVRPCRGNCRPSEPTRD